MPRPSFVMFDLLSDPPADHSSDVLDVTPCAVPGLTNTPSRPEHSLGLVESTITLVGVPLTIKIFVHGGTTASATFLFCHALKHWPRLDI